MKSKANSAQSTGTPATRSRKTKCNKCNKKGPLQSVTNCNRYTSTFCYTNSGEDRAEPRKQRNLTVAEVKDVYLKLKVEGIVPTVRLVREQLKHGSYSTLQNIISELNQEFANNLLTEIQRKRVPDEVMTMLLNELTERALQCTIKEDDTKIDELEKTILKLTEDHAKTDAEYAAQLDECIGRNNELISDLNKNMALVTELEKENSDLKNQIAVLSSQIEQDRAKYNYLNQISILLKAISENPDIVDKILEV